MPAASWPNLKTKNFFLPAFIQPWRCYKTKPRSTNRSLAWQQCHWFIFSPALWPAQLHATHQAGLRVCDNSTAIMGPRIPPSLPSSCRLQEDVEAACTWLGQQDIAPELSEEIFLRGKSLKCMHCKGCLPCPAVLLKPGHGKRMGMICWILSTASTLKMGAAAELALQPFPVHQNKTQAGQQWCCTLEEYL